MIEQSAGLPIGQQPSLADRVIAFIRAQGRPAWLVGGFVRDRLLGRDNHDLDLIVPEGGIRLARAVAAAFGGASFVLDDVRDVGRAIVSDPTGESLDVDVARLRVPDLLDDLALRDFTVNAIAMDAIAMDAIAMDIHTAAARRPCSIRSTAGPICHDACCVR